MQLKRVQRYFRRSVKAQQKQVEQLSTATERGIERYLFKRFQRLKKVRRFVFGWVALVLLITGVSIAQFQQLSAYYQRNQPVSGGIYSEGIVGAISNVNPIYATSDVDRSLSRLLFAGLLTYDVHGDLVPSLATDYTVKDNGKLYTVHLKHGLTWHDGEPLTSADVVYTLSMIKDPDARSPLLASWQSIKVAAPDAYTVTFTLPSTLASFPYNLTTGIVPQHILANVKPANLRSSDFNTIKPIGAGPFLWHGLQVTGNDPAEREEQVALLPFNKYQGGAPKLDEFIMRVYVSADHLRSALNSGQLTAAAGLDSYQASKRTAMRANSLILSAGTYVFFKNTQPLLSSSKTRQALVAAADPGNIISKLGYATRPVTEPLLEGQLGYNKNYAQKTNNLAAAKQLLIDDGWKAGQNGVLRKDGKPLRFSLLATDTPEYRTVTKLLKQQWQAIGAVADVQLLSANDYATALDSHDYDATLYGIAIGKDPDVYVYWDSSQADIRSNTRLNLSEWKNSAADSALLGGRTRVDPAVRVVKYAPLLQAWQQDAPALGLYQPRYLYITRGQVYGLTEQTITSSTDRFNGVESWRIRTARVSQ